MLLSSPNPSISNFPSPMALNGSLAGLVGITAGADVVSVMSSIIIGFIANAIFKGINDYFKRYPIPGTVYGQHIILKEIALNHNKPVYKPSYKSAKKFHKVVRGDSLSMLAKRYHLSIKELKRVNKMRSNTLILGKKLIIPQ